VRHAIYSYRWLTVVLVAILLLLLSACNRPLQTLEQLEEPTPAFAQQPQIEIPTAVPAQPDPVIEQPVPTDPINQEPVTVETPDTPVTTDPTPLPPQPTTPGEPVNYVVQRGDTLGRIAQQYNVSIEDLAAANNLTNIHSLQEGQVLIIPVGGVVVSPPQTGTGERIHVVQVGENLFRIGLRYGVTADQIAQYNNLANVHRIYVGQELRIPPTP
jgi:LysM repeat protein